MCKRISALPAQGKVDAILELDPGGECEGHSVSDSSPGPVTGDELLARKVDIPTHVRGDPPTAIEETLFEDATTIGASVQRLLRGWSDQSVQLHHRNEEAARRRRDGTDGRPAAPGRRYLGVLQIAASEVRSVQIAAVPIARRARVYDTAAPGDEGHADIVLNVAGLNKSQRKQLRVMLLTEACRRGLFASPYADPEDLLTIGVPLTH